MKLNLLLASLVLFPVSSHADVFKEVAFASNFIWRGYSLSNNRPVVQGALGYESKSHTYAGSAYSNVEFSNPAYNHAEAKKDIDFFLGQKWNWGEFNFDLRYSKYTFFEAWY